MRSYQARIQNKHCVLNAVKVVTEKIDKLVSVCMTMAMFGLIMVLYFESGFTEWNKYIFKENYLNMNQNTL